MPSKQKDPFSASKKKLVATLVISAAVHAAFIFSFSTIHFSPRSIVAATKKLPSPCMFEPIPAAKERALSQTLNRFFPFIAHAQSSKKTLLSPQKEMSSSLFKPRKRGAESFGEDLESLINFDIQSPDLNTLSAGASSEALFEAHLGASFPFDAPLSLETSDLLRGLETPNVAIQQGGEELAEDGINLTSSTFKLGKAPDSDPFELEPASNQIEKANIPSTTSLPCALFETGAAADTSPLPSQLEPFSPHESELLAPDLPHVNITSEVFDPIQKKGEFGAIYSDHFTCETECFQVKDKALYAFRIEISPTSLAHFTPLDHEIFFLIDRSNSIDKINFEAFKRSVSHALGLLPKKTLFNLCIFDKTADTLEASSVLATRSNLVRAKTFLIGQDHGGLFATTDLFKALTNIKTTIGPDGVASAILLSDGDTFLSPQEQKERLIQFTQNKDPNLSLFTVASGANNNLELLDTIATLSRGSLTYEETRPLITQRFATLMRMLAAPIVKNISLTTNDKNVTFLTPSHRRPIMYARAPYTIVGYTTHPQDFTLFVQGTGKKGPITIKKVVRIKPEHKSNPKILDEVEKQSALAQIESSLMRSHEP